MSVNLREPRNYYCQQTRSLLRQQAGLFLIASKLARCYASMRAYS
ncbi:hypothetical protein [Paraglaciecola agarilytica]|nr:hypothetical protein [Paraglaciecola agarilytica]